jgi:hypothetical protein
MERKPFSSSGAATTSTVVIGKLFYKKKRSKWSHGEEEGRREV